MIAFEYFRFEMWIQQSGLMTVDDTGNPTITDDSIRRCIQISSNLVAGRPGPIDSDRFNSHILTIFGEVYGVLNNLKPLKMKYRIDSTDEGTEEPSNEPEPPASRERKRQRTNAPSTIFDSSPVAEAIDNARRQRREQSSRVSFFKKVNFGWALTDDTSDRDKIAGLIKELKYWNDALREMLPPGERRFSDAVVSVRALSLSENNSELADIGNAAHAVGGQLYDDICTACAIKAKRLQEQPASTDAVAFESMKLAKERISRIEQMLTEPQRQITAYFSGTVRLLSLLQFPT